MNDATNSDAERQAKREAMEDHLENLFESTEALLRSTASYTGAEIEAARKQLKEQMKTAREQLSNNRNIVKQQAYRAISAAEECVNEHPWKSLTAAVFFGMLLGKCMGGGHHSNR